MRKRVYRRIAMASFFIGVVVAVASIWGWALLGTSHVIQGAGAYTFGLAMLVAVVFGITASGS